MTRKHVYKKVKPAVPHWFWYCVDPCWNCPYCGHWGCKRGSCKAAKKVNAYNRTKTKRMPLDEY